VKDELEVSQKADLIPGADELVRELKRRGYPLALVADGPTGTFINNLTPHGVYQLFDVYAISDQVGVQKPDPLIFHHAMNQLGIAAKDYGNVVMLGNHLGRDVKGANELGIISVWLDWAPRRHKIPVDDSEIPRYTIKLPMDLLKVIDELEAES
ncbi:MAG: HAD family hydrolase, partial [Chloroflexota bacterium]